VFRRNRHAAGAGRMAKLESPAACIRLGVALKDRFRYKEAVDHFRRALSSRILRPKTGRRHPGSESLMTGNRLSDRFLRKGRHHLITSLVGMYSVKGKLRPQAAFLVGQRRIVV